MTKTNMDLSELLAKRGEGDLLRSIAEAVLQLIMEAHVDGLIGAGRHERIGERTTWRNGYRDRSLDTRLGTLNLRGAQAAPRQLLPGLPGGPQDLGAGAGGARHCLSDQWRSNGSLQEAWIGGVSTRRFDDLVQAMGLSGISKSTVSKLCKE